MPMEIIRVQIIHMTMTSHFNMKYINLIMAALGMFYAVYSSKDNLYSALNYSLSVINFGLFIEG
jgi:nicotinamide riboside transporter PnuC